MMQLPARAATRFQLDAKAKLPPLSTHLAAQFRPSATADRPSRPLAATTNPELSRKFAEGLQLTRASTIALTRLQLALAGGDRRLAMAAIDRLHAIDGEIEHLVEQLPPSAPDRQDHEPGGFDESGPDQPGLAAAVPAPSDDPVAALGKHLADQKLALAFEKLALASGISGPDLVSPELVSGALASPDAEPDGPPAPAASQPSPIDWHAFPEVHTVVWDRVPTKLWGVLLALLVTVVVVAAAMMMIAMI